MPRVRVPRHVARLVSRLVVDYFDDAAHPVASARRAACCATHRRLLRLGRLVVDYFAYAARLGASARRVARRVARRRLLHLRRASGCFGTTRGFLRDSSSTTSPRAGSSSTTSPTPRVRVPRHVARLIVDYFDYAARPGASARRAARRPARCRLLRLRCAFGCLGTSRGSSPSSSLTTSTTSCVRVPRHVARLVVDYFIYAVRPVASARRAAHHVARRVARRRLLRLSRASGRLDTSRGSLRGSLSTTSSTSCVRLLRYVARLVARLVVNYFAYAARPGASARRAARQPARRRLLRRCRTSGCFGTSRSLSRDSASTTSPRAGSSSTTSPTPRVRVPRHVARLVTRLVADYFDYAALLTVKIRQPSHEFTFGVGISFIPYPLVQTPVI
jgi:hypothetical protein